MVIIFLFYLYNFPYSSWPINTCRAICGTKYIRHSQIFHISGISKAIRGHLEWNNWRPFRNFDGNHWGSCNRVVHYFSDVPKVNKFLMFLWLCLQVFQKDNSVNSFLDPERQAKGSYTITFFLFRVTKIFRVCHTKFVLC